MIHLTPLAASISSEPALSETLQYQLVGFTVVMSTLVSIWLILELTGFFFHRSQQAKQARQRILPPTQAAGLSHREIAAISAAVHTTIKGPFHILTIEAHDQLLQTQSHPQQQAWSMEGRRAIFSSHRVR
jgi:hypothetical protein